MSETHMNEIYRDRNHPILWYLERILCFVLAMALAAFVTLALLYLEQFLIESGDAGIDPSPNLRMVEMVRVKREVEVLTRERKAKPKPPDELPEAPQPNLAASFDVDASFSLSNPADGVVSTLDRGLGFGISDGDYLPLVKVAPVYPRRALLEGLAGWVIVEFTVSRSGNVLQPMVVDHCAIPQRGAALVECVDRPNNIFDRSALKAAGKFRYKPKVIDGEPIETSGVRNRITFELDA